VEDKKLDLEDVREKAKPLLDRHNVQKAEVFGSYARNEQDEESDIDLLVEMKEGTTLIDIAELKKELEEKLNVKVDVLTHNSIHPEIRRRVQDEAVEI
jgi:predicted nucleotidyltransferase